MISLALLVGCGAGGNHGGNHNNSTIENGFNQTIDDSAQAVQSYATSNDPAADVGDYYAHVSGNLDHMDDLWNQMYSHCDNYNDCPRGGGLTGDDHSGCMQNGHLLDGGQMTQLHDTIAAARAELQHHWDSCGNYYNPSTCDGYRQQHTQAMHGIFSGMYDDCHGWWSQQDGPWGDCGDHHGPMN